MHEQQLEADGGHEILDEGRMAVDEVLIVQQRTWEFPDGDVGKAVELTAGIEKVSQRAAEGERYVEQCA